jgi:hypothetical protein
MPLQPASVKCLKRTLTRNIPVSVHLFADAFLCFFPFFISYPSLNAGSYAT